MILLTKTDMLDWNKLNPIVRIVDVNKLFYGRYLFKVKSYCPGGRTIYSKDQDSMNQLIELRKSRDGPNYNWGGSWHSFQDASTLKKYCKIDQLEFFRILNLEKKSKKIYIRIEEPEISIYSNDEPMLYELIAKNYPSRLVEVHKPESNHAKEILLKGEIIVKNDFEYDYKIFLKAQAFDSTEIKNLLESKFNQLAGLVNVPTGIKKFLVNDKLYFPGGYFYCKNIETTTYMQLVFPTLISSIFKLTHLNS